MSFLYADQHDTNNLGSKEVRELSGTLASVWLL